MGRNVEGLVGGAGPGQGDGSIREPGKGFGRCFSAEDGEVVVKSDQWIALEMKRLL